MEYNIAPSHDIYINLIGGLGLQQLFFRPTALAWRSQIDRPCRCGTSTSVWAASNRVSMRDKRGMEGKKKKRDAACDHDAPPRPVLRWRGITHHNPKDLNSFRIAERSAPHFLGKVRW